MHSVNLVDHEKFVYFPNYLSVKFLSLRSVLGSLIGFFVRKKTVHGLFAPFSVLFALVVVDQSYHI